MKTRMALIVVMVLMFGLGIASAQAAPALQVEKSIGQPLTIGWDYPATGEIDIDSFVVENCTGVNVGCTDAGPVILKTLRAFTVTVTSALTAKPFFQVRSIKGTARSTTTNPVAVTIRITPPNSAYGL